MGVYPRSRLVITQRVISISELFDERSNNGFSQSDLGGSTSLSPVVLQLDVPVLKSPVMSYIPLQLLPLGCPKNPSRGNPEIPKSRSMIMPLISTGAIRVYIHLATDDRLGRLS